MECHNKITQPIFSTQRKRKYDAVAAGRAFWSVPRYFRLRVHIYYAYMSKIKQSWSETMRCSTSQKQSLKCFSLFYQICLGL